MNARGLASVALAATLAGCGSRTPLDVPAQVGPADAAAMQDGAPVQPDAGCLVTETTTLVARDSSTWFGSSLVVAGSDVYWLEHGDLMDGPGRLMRMNACGGQPVQVASTANYPGSLVIAGAIAYWTGWDPSTQDGSLASIAPGSAAPSTLATSYRAGSLAVSEPYVYWADDEAIDRTSPSGGAVATFASGQFPQGIAVNATSVAWTNSAARGWWVTVAPLGGGAPATVAAGSTGNLGFSDAIALDGSNVYFTYFDPGYGASGAIVRAPLTGGAISTLASGIHPTALVLDGYNLYWGQGFDNGTGAIVRISTSGGAPVTVASGMQDVPQQVAVDASRVYWTGGTSILAAPK